MNGRTIVSLCDFSGNWAAPYRDAGFHVVLVDPKHADRPAEGFDTFAGTVEEFLGVMRRDPIADVVGILAAPPCTHFTSSGAQYWKEKDADGRTRDGLAIVDACLDVIDLLKPFMWCLENPVGRLPSLRPYRLGRPRLFFDPYEFAGWADDPDSEAYTKRTGLYGWFNADLRRDAREPQYIVSSTGSRFSPLHWLSGGKRDRAELRSITPTGFARAFFEANHRPLLKF